MKSKNIGIVLIVLGLVLMVYTGFDYVTTKRVVDIGSVKINKEENHAVRWSPILGAIFLVGGVLALAVNNNKSN